MSKLQDALNEAAQETTKLPVNMCRVCYLLRTLQPDDQHALEIALDNKTITNQKMKVVIRETLDFEVGFALDRHRKGICKGQSA